MAVLALLLRDRRRRQPATLGLDLFDFHVDFVELDAVAVLLEVR